MGRIGDLYRVALFDSEKPLARRLPVKDVPVLPTNVDYLNCSVINGVLTPNLGGSKIMCSVAKKLHPKADATDEHDKRNTKDIRRFWIDIKVEPKYQYGFTEHGLGRDRMGYYHKFYPGSLLHASNAWNIWDETCTDDTFYLIAVLANRKSSKRFSVTGSILAMDSKGNLHFTNTNDMRICMNSGVRYVQVASPTLSYPETYLGSRLCTGRVPLVGIDKDDESRIIWHGRKKINEVNPVPVESVWWNTSWRTTVCDFRKYINAKVFGINSAADASMIIFPEGVEELWLGFMQFCSSLKSIYIPPSVERIYDYGIPVRRVKKVTVYSSSPAVIAFCEKYGVERIDCDNADDMTEKFYQASGGDYVSAEDASSIASLAGAQSDRSGEGGTIWSAALFSITSKGFATETLREKYPVVDTSKGRYKKPDPRKVTNAGVADGNCVPSNEYGEEVTRTFAGALTQFYPPTDKPITSDPSTVEYVRYKLGEYELYIGFFAFKQRPAGSVLVVPKSIYGGYYASREHFKKTIGDVSGNYHEGLLVSPEGEVVHRFACPYTLVRILKNIEGALTTGTEPSGVLRYADKLPNLYKWTYGRNDEGVKVRDALFHSFLVFTYNTKKAKRVMVGIDLHSGALATAEYTTHDYDSVVITPAQSQSQRGQRPNFYVSVNRLSNIQLHPEDTDLSELFPADCLYNKGR